MIINNESKKVSQNCKQRIDRRIKLDDNLKTFLRKIKSEKKRKYKISIKLNN